VGYFTDTRRLGVSFVLTLPLLVAYQIGLLAVGFEALNGADFVTRMLLKLGGVGFLVANATLLLVFGLTAAAMKGKGTAVTGYFVPLLIESGLYAVGLGYGVLAVMREVQLVAWPAASAAWSLPPDALARIVISAGAGFHEELVFRVGLFLGLGALLTKLFGEDWKGLAAAIALVVSSLAFSLAHFTSEPFAWFPFWFRLFAGAAFGALCWARGFAVAVYTHALYDVWVLLAQGGGS
jgi:membrane protease YdiL (CAAX protease family)